MLRGEDPEMFAGLCGRLAERFAPADEIGDFLVWRLASAMWRCQRAERLEVEAIQTREHRPHADFADGYNPNSPAVWDAGRGGAKRTRGGRRWRLRPAP